MQVFSLSDQMKSKHQKCVLDSLYMSVKFCKKYYKFNNSVLVLVVTHKIVFGLWDRVNQGIFTRKNDTISSRGTVKADVLTGDREFPNKNTASVYDTKPIIFLSTACGRLVEGGVKCRIIVNKLMVI